MNSSPIVAGIDVSKAKLDVYIHPAGNYRTFNNKAQDFEEISNFLKQHNVTKVGFEATGGYEKLCAHALLATGLQVYIIQAKWVRDYGRSLGITAKTDKIDSSLIARYVSNPDMRASVLSSNHVHVLKELSCRREQLVEILKIKKIQKQQITNLSIVKKMDKLIEVLQGQIKNLEYEMTETFKTEPDLAQQLLKSPYNLGFLSLHDKIQEKELENKLVQHIRDFLLELGTGFSFVGNQYRLELEGEIYYIDLLFYHLKLRCYVIIELKSGKFLPEYAGKMNFYLNLIDKQLKKEEDNQSIGIILCRDKKGTTVEFALKGMMSPLGVSEYTLTGTLPKELKNVLPSAEELSHELED